MSTTRKTNLSPRRSELVKFLVRVALFLDNSERGAVLPTEQSNNSVVVRPWPGKLSISDVLKLPVWRRKQNEQNSERG